VATWCFESGLLAGGSSVELRLPSTWPPVNLCRPLLPTGEVNPACNGYFAYDRSQRTRTTSKTEQLSLRSNYLQRVDFTGRFSYSDGSVRVPQFDETFSGLISRSRARSFETTGSDTVDPINVTADFGATIRLNRRFRLVDNFRLIIIECRACGICPHNLFGQLSSQRQTNLTLPLPTSIYGRNVSSTQREFRADVALIF
jgi:hypothetical protein